MAPGEESYGKKRLEEETEEHTSAQSWVKGGPSWRTCEEEEQRSRAGRRSPAAPLDAPKLLKLVDQTHSHPHSSGGSRKHPSFAEQKQTTFSSLFSSLFAFVSKFNSMISCALSKSSYRKSSTVLTTYVLSTVAVKFVILNKHLSAEHEYRYYRRHTARQPCHAAKALKHKMITPTVQTHPLNRLPQHHLFLWVLFFWRPLTDTPYKYGDL